MKLLLALDHGWLIRKVELVPSWDQHGLVYLVTIHSQDSGQSRQVILPRNALVERLLETRHPGSLSIQFGLQPMGI